MKMTLDISERILRQAKVLAAQTGITLQELLKQAVEEKLKGQRRAGKAQPNWLRLEGVFGRTAAARAETRRIQEVVESEFERLESED